MKVETTTWKTITLTLQDVLPFVKKGTKQLREKGIYLELDDEKLLDHFVPKGYDVDENYIDSFNVYCITCHKEEK